MTSALPVDAKMQGYLYMEDRGSGSRGQRWGSPHTPVVKESPANRGGVVPRQLIALDKAALGVSEDWRARIALRTLAKRKESSVRVVARFRPPSQAELEVENRDCERAFRVRSGSQRIEALEGPQNWEFDVTFGEDSSQEAVYNAAGRPVIAALLDGYNGTIFAYGQTGSGKTHSMFGPSHDLLHHAADSSGIVPRAAQHVFDHIRDGVDGSEFVLRCSLFEVYREQLRDLLDPANPNLRIKETPRQGVFVDGLAQEFVSCEDDVVRLIRAGSRLRAVAATRLNQHSSRSHVIFSLTCEQRLADGTEKLAKLNLVDLAGSEKVWKSSSSGVTLEEAKKINLSLSALGNVINALAARRGHVPYRNSKLTRILQETLGGNFKTALVVTCSPLRMHQDETLSSLHFATRAKAVCNHVKVNFVYSSEQLMAFVERLQQELLMTRREIAKVKHDGCAIPVGLPETPVASDVATLQQQRLHWDASVLNETCGRSLCGPSPTPRPQKKHGRLLSLADETKPVLLRALSAQEELIVELKAVKGAGLAHELLGSPAAGLTGCTSARRPGHTMSWETLLVQQTVCHKLLQRQDLARQLATQQRRQRSLEGRREEVASHSDYVDAQLAQMASELQSARETLAEEPRSRAHSAQQSCEVPPHSLDETSSSCEVAAALEDGGMQNSSALDIVQEQQLSKPNVCESQDDASKALGIHTTGCSDSGEALAPLDVDDEVMQLRNELEMLKVDSERQARMHDLIKHQTNMEQQRWYEWAKQKLADLDHTEEQTRFEDQRLRELMERRGAELLKTRERVAQSQIEVLAKQNESRIIAHRLQLETSAAEAAASSQELQMHSRCVELDDDIAVLKAGRQELQVGAMPYQQPQEPINAAPIKQLHDPTQVGPRRNEQLQKPVHVAPIKQLQEPRHASSTGRFGRFDGMPWRPEDLGA